MDTSSPRVTDTSSGRIVDTPSARIVAAAGVALHAVDEAGRALELRRLGALDKLRLFKALGPVLSQNAPYLGMAMLASSVTAIDGVPVPPPVTEAQVEQMVGRLGDGGIAAVAEALRPAGAMEDGAAAGEDGAMGGSAADRREADAAGN
ncbi:MAG: hypothetical protein ACRYHQ_10785 [Janthinobacterium lividum]